MTAKFLANGGTIDLTKNAISFDAARGFNALSGSAPLLRIFTSGNLQMRNERQQYSYAALESLKDISFIYDGKELQRCAVVDYSQNIADKTVTLQLAGIQHSAYNKDIEVNAASNLTAAQTLSGANPSVSITPLTPFAAYRIPRGTGYSQSLKRFLSDFDIAFDAHIFEDRLGAFRAINPSDDRREPVAKINFDEFNVVAKSLSAKLNKEWRISSAEVFQIGFGSRTQRGSLGAGTLVDARYTWPLENKYRVRVGGNNVGWIYVSRGSGNYINSLTLSVETDDLLRIPSSTTWRTRTAVRFSSRPRAEIRNRGGQRAYKDFRWSITRGGDIRCDFNISELTGGSFQGRPIGYYYTPNHEGFRGFELSGNVAIEVQFNTGEYVTTNTQVIGSDEYNRLPRSGFPYLPSDRSLYEARLRRLGNLKRGARMTFPLRQPSAAARAKLLDIEVGDIVEFNITEPHMTLQEQAYVVYSRWVIHGRRAPVRELHFVTKQAKSPYLIYFEDGKLSIKDHLAQVYANG